MPFEHQVERKRSVLKHFAYFVSSHHATARRAGKLLCRIAFTLHSLASAVKDGDAIKVHRTIVTLHKLARYAEQNRQTALKIKQQDSQPQSKTLTHTIVTQVGQRTECICKHEDQSNTQSKGSAARPGFYGRKGSHTQEIWNYTVCSERCRGEQTISSELPGFIIQKRCAPAAIHAIA